MCGFAGIRCRDRASPEHLNEMVRRMNAVLHPRGPDMTGYWADPQGHAAFGFSRLAIQDLSVEANQPMRSESGRYVMVFNGEIYNADDLRRRIGREPRSFRTHSDTEVLLACVEKLGMEAALQLANGMWAIGLWDAQTHKLFLARDRFGKKPLHYWATPQGVLFASEIKALLAAGVAPAPPVCAQALRSYFELNYVPAPMTIYENIRKVRPACIVEIAATGELKETPYYRLDEVITHAALHPLRDLSVATAEAEQLLKDAVRIRLISDVPTGVLLSGGVDSSLVAHALGRELGIPLQTFTVRVDDEVLDESQEASAIARRLEVPNRILHLTSSEALARVDSVFDYLDEPFGDSSYVAVFGICELARAHATVLLTGDGGDEVFGGYTRYIWSTGWRWMAARLYATFRARRPWMSNADVALEIYRRLMTIGTDGGSIGAERLEQLAGGLRHFSASVLQYLRYIDFQLYQPDDILTKTDRMSMANSIELRSPFLDYRLVELSWRLSDSCMVHAGERKRITCGLFAARIGQQYLQRKKQGFAIPMARWLSGPLRDQAETALEEVARQPELPLQVKRLRTWWEATKRGNASAAYNFWVVFAYWRWMQGVAATQRNFRPSAVGV